MANAQKLREQARILRAQANEQVSAEAALAARALAAAYESRAAKLDAETLDGSAVKPRARPRAPR